MPNIPNDLSRRDLLKGSAAAGIALVIPGVSGIRSSEVKPMEVKLIEPRVLPEKVKNTAAVGISMKTHEEHAKLWNGYVNKTNEIRKALAELEIDPAKANQIFSQIRALKVDYTFAYEGLINHDVYFDTIGGSGGPATGAILDLINASYGSFDKWLIDWKATGMAGRGWVYLGYDHAEKRVFNYIGDAQNSYPVFNTTLVLAMDVYEHAYFLDFQTARAKYIEAYVQTIDWAAVNARLANAK